MFAIGFSIIQLSLLVIVPGFLIYSLCFNNKQNEKYELIHIFSFVMLFGILFNSLLGFLLLALGVYTLELLFLISICFNTGLMVIALYQKTLKSTLANICLGNRFVLSSIIICIIIACMLYMTPSESVIPMGMDESGYILKAYHFMHNGSLFLDSIPRVLFNDILSSAEFPGINYYMRYIENLGVHEWAYYSLLSVPYAIVLQLLGINAMLRVSLVYGILCSLFFFLIIKKLFKLEWLSVIAFIIFLFSPILIHFSRMALTETFYLMTIMAGICLLIELKNGQNYFISVITAIVLSSLAIIRPDFIMNYAGFGFLLLFEYLQEKSDFPKKQFFVFGVTYLTFSWLYFALMIYFRRNTTGVLGVSLNIVHILLALAVVLYIIFHLPPTKKVIEKITKSKLFMQITSSSLLYDVALLSLILYLTFALIIRAIFSTQVFAYVEPFTMHVRGLRYLFPFDLFSAVIPIINFITFIPATISILGIAGICFMLRAKQKEYFVFIFPFIFAMVAVLYNMMHSNFIYYNSRRFMYGAFPIFVFGTIYLLSQFHARRIHRYINIKVVVLLFLITINLIFNSGIMLYRTAIIFSGKASSLQEFREHFIYTDFVVLDGGERTTRGLQLALFHYFEVDSLAPIIATVSNSEFLNMYDRLSEKGRQLVVVASDQYQLNRVRLLFEYTKDEIIIPFTHYRGGVAHHYYFDAMLLRLVGVRICGLLRDTPIPYNESADFRFTIDNISLDESFFHIHGWAFVPSENRLDYEAMIVLSYNGYIHVFSAFQHRREDVASHFTNHGYNLKQSGFDTFIPIELLEARVYDVGIMLRNINTNEMFFRLVEGVYINAYTFEHNQP